MIISITNKFGVPHSITGTHEGIDFTTLDLMVKYPFEKGRCLWVGNEPSGLGLYCVFRWIDTETKKAKIVVMGHFEYIVCKVGDLLWKGSPIGKMGQSGNAQGIHTHIELHAPIDPEPFLNES